MRLNWRRFIGLLLGLALIAPLVLVSAACSVEARCKFAEKDTKFYKENCNGQASAGKAPEKKKPASSSGCVRPSGGAVTSEYGMRNGRMHNGIDFGAALGTPLYAAKAGKISFADFDNPEGFGAYIDLWVSKDTMLRYGHPDTWSVKAGDEVAKGQKIGTVGQRGNSTGPHLHFEVHKKGTNINPKPWLQACGVKL